MSDRFGGSNAIEEILELLNRAADLADEQGVPFVMGLIEGPGGDNGKIWLRDSHGILNAIRAGRMMITPFEMETDKIWDSFDELPHAGSA